MFVYITLFTCAALMVLLVRRYDLYEKEPWYMVLVAIALGVAWMWSAGQMEDLILRHLHLPAGDLAVKASIVAFIEELAKLMAVLSVAILFSHHFTDALDGLVYGTLGGLGMAIEESLMYLSLTPDKNALALGAEVVRLFGHSLMGGLLGFAVGLTLRNPHPEQPRRVALPLTCVAVALVVHFCWDYIAYRPHVAIAMRGMLMLLMLCLMIVWGIMVAYGMELSRKFLRADGYALPAVQ